MAGPNRLAGQATLSVAGQTYMIVGELTYRVNDFTVETLKGQDGIHGTKEMAQTGMIKAKLRDSGSISVSSLAAMRDVNVVAQLANGKVVSGNDMWRVGEPPEVNTEDGTFDIEWEGLTVSEN
ncbi:MAG: phage tail tube protein [Caulobacteraceae bacterium]|nr:phage tail tube protein [Caulobacteraceae bacterium]